MSEKGAQGCAFFSAGFDNDFITGSFHGVDEMLNEDGIILRIDSQRIANAERDSRVSDVQCDVECLFG